MGRTMYKYKLQYSLGFENGLRNGGHPGLGKWFCLMDASHTYCCCGAARPPVYPPPPTALLVVFAHLAFFLHFHDRQLPLFRDTPVSSGFRRTRSKYTAVVS